MQNRPSGGKGQRPHGKRRDAEARAARPKGSGERPKGAGPRPQGAGPRPQLSGPRPLVEGKIMGLAEEIAGPLGIELVDVELLGSGSRSILRVTIDKPGGVGLDDCEAMSRDFGALMDVEDLIKNRYVIEVSSPGLDRPLKKPRDFEKSVGKLVRIVLNEKQIEKQGLIIGRLTGFGDEVAVLDVDGAEVRVPLSNVKKARLEVEI